MVNAKVLECSTWSQILLFSAPGEEPLIKKLNRWWTLQRWNQALTEARTGRETNQDWGQKHGYYYLRQNERNNEKSSCGRRQRQALISNSIMNGEDVMPELENWMDTWKPNEVFSLAFISHVSKRKNQVFRACRFCIYSKLYIKFILTVHLHLLSISWISIRNSHFPIVLYTSYL